MVADALSKRYALISKLDVKLLGFEYIKDLYYNDPNFANVYRAYEKGSFDKFYKFDDFLGKQIVCATKFFERVTYERGI